MTFATGVKEPNGNLRGLEGEAEHIPALKASVHRYAPSKLPSIALPRPTFFSLLLVSTLAYTLLRPNSKPHPIRHRDSPINTQLLHHIPHFLQLIIRYRFRKTLDVRNGG
jgi:hypothetical protein